MRITLLRTRMSAAALTAATLTSTACSNRTREVPLRGTFLVTGKMALSESTVELVRNTPPIFSWIDKNGLRNPLTNVQFDPSTGDISFEFKRENFIRRMGYSLPEFNSLMGWAKPLERLSTQGYEDTETGFIRFEAYSEISNGDSGIVKYYLQKVAGLPMSASFSTGKTLVVDTAPIATYQVGVVKVKVTDTSGSPVSNALVSVIPLNVTGGKTYDVKPYDFRTQSPFTPAANLTDGTGVAMAWPIPVGTDKSSKFQISVSREGFCTQMSAPAFHEPTMSPVEIVLPACSQQQTVHGEIDWEVSYPNGMFVLGQERGTLPQGTGYTNQEQVELQFTNRSGIIRGFTLQIHEGQTTDDAVIMTQEFPTFANRLVVDLPPTFANGTSNSGTFLINMIARLSDQDKAAGRKAFSKKLIGNKGIFRIEPALQEDFEVIGHKTFQNLISGQSDATFTVKYSKCKEGYKIGVAVSPEGKKNPDVTLSACSASGNIFNLKDVFKGFSKQSGNNVIQFFRTDEFQNISADDISVSPVNRRTIEIDYGSPDPAQLFLDTDIAVVANSTTLPVMQPVTTPRVELTAATLSDYSLVFTNTGAGSICEFANPVPVQDMVSPDSTSGRAIDVFYVGGPKSKAEMLSGAAACSGGKFQLSPALVKLPAISTQNATLKLTVFDKAGNYASGTVSITPCVPDTGQKVCWKQ
ncbi:MAG: hypothetical protein EBR09_02020 [Proteobacteria bacterium]|nr:hypothetical protein [Pseudomonadota bacterium]